MGVLQFHFPSSSRCWRMGVLAQGGVLAGCPPLPDPVISLISIIFPPKMTGPEEIFCSVLFFKRTLGIFCIFPSNEAEPPLFMTGWGIGDPLGSVI